jgi:uncharacterized Tic20 family protein
VQANTDAPTLSPAERQLRLWSMFCHLSSLLGLLIPFANLVAPFLIWQIKKHDLPALNDHGREAVNFQLSVLIYAVAFGVVVGLGLLTATILSVVLIGIPMFYALTILGGAGFCVLYFGSIALAVVAGVKANDGELFRYPLSLRIIN